MDLLFADPPILFLMFWFDVSCETFRLILSLLESLKISFAVWTQVEQKVETAQVGHEFETFSKHLVVGLDFNRTGSLGGKSVSIVDRIVGGDDEVGRIFDFCIDFHLLQYKLKQLGV